MAEIIGGIATTHSPMLSTDADFWATHAQRDEKKTDLVGSDGRRYTYTELLDQADPDLCERLTLDNFRSQHAACHDAMQQLSKFLRENKPDVVVVIGDDQEELFLEDNMPAFSIYWGKTITNIKPPMEGRPKGMQLSAWGYYDENPTDYPGEPDLGLHIVRQLIEEGVDVAQFQRQREGVGMSHAFTFMHRRIMPNPSVPMVPVFINTYYPPNQPTARRAVDFGHRLREAITNWPQDKRVVVMASGGLSHFVVDEELDQMLLNSLKSNDEQALMEIPESRLQSGNSEAKNWMALGACVNEHAMTLIDYIPVYRSPAGTGCAMAFASWR